MFTQANDITPKHLCFEVCVSKFMLNGIDNYILL